MNDFNLKKKLDALVVPERDPEYWESFPQRVLAELRTVPQQRPCRRPWMPRFACRLAWPLAGLAAVFCLCQSRLPKTVSCALLKNEKELRSTLGQFPKRLSTLMQDEHGLHRLVEDPQ